MIRFASGNTRSVNTGRAIDECLEIAFPQGVPGDCGLILFHCSIGHKADRLGAMLKEKVPGAAVLGNTCGGVIGRQGVGDSMNEMGILCLCGPREEYPFVPIEDVTSANSYEKAFAQAQALKALAPNPAAIYLLNPGIDVNNTLVLRAFDDVYGPDITLFGGKAADNMVGEFTQEFANGASGNQVGWAVAFADPTLKAITRASHGFAAYGEPMIVTKAKENMIYELDGKPAGLTFRERLSVPADAPPAAIIAMGAMGEKLPEALAKEYGNPHILRAVLRVSDEGTLTFPVNIQEGTALWLTMRDEELIFSEQERSLAFMKEEIGSGEIVMAMQTDCLARGRMLFNKVVKDELITMIQSALAGPDGETPPWLGMYAFGEYARLGGHNTFHNYTTSLIALYR